MDVVAALIADREASELPQPHQRAFHHPAVPAQPVTRVDPFAGDADVDVPPGQRRPAAGDVIRLVGMELGRARPALPARASDRRNGVDHLLEDRTVVPIGAGEMTRQRGPASVGNNMALRARFAAVRRVRSGGGSPFLAGMLALSRHARSQSIASARPNSSSST